MAGQMCQQCKGKQTVIAGIFEVNCPTCQGTGSINDPDVCTKCNGSKKMVANGFEIDCDACNGTGTREAQLAIEAEQAQQATT